MTDVATKHRDRMVPYRAIGNSLVVTVLLVNAIFSLATTSAQLYAAYHRDRFNVISSIATIDQSFRPGLEKALWEYNYGLIEALLDGVEAKNDVEFVEVRSSDGQLWVRGQADAESEISEVLSLYYVNQAGLQVPVGELELGLTLDSVRARVWAQFWTVMSSNFAKTALASVVLLFLFDRRVTKHLKTVAEHVSVTSWLDVGRPLRLDRSSAGPSDDIDMIVAAINGAKRRSQDDFHALRVETEQRRAVEQQLLQKAATLEAANKEQAEFTYAISHDLKSPSNTIRMLLDEIDLEDGPQMSDYGQEMVRAAKETNLRMARLIDDILAYARTVEDEIEKEPIILQRLVGTIVEDLRADIQDTGAEVTCAHVPKFMGSKLQIRLLIQNLIANGIKFHKPGRAPRIDIGGSTSTDDGAVTLWVKDNGIGISPDYHDRIFGMFQRLHPHDVYSGSGLGLAICQRVVNNHGGEIRVTSTPDEGTTFWITFPDS